jgi:NADH-ubiquinone oxidoreductase chain 5
MLNCDFKEIILFLSLFFYWGAFYMMIHLIILFLFLNTNFDVFVVDFFLIKLMGVKFSYTLIFDYYSFGFIRFVFLISSIVLFYRFFYIGHDLRPRRFVILINFFVLSMAILVMSPSIIRIMLG